MVKLNMIFCCFSSAVIRNGLYLSICIVIIREPLDVLVEIISVGLLKTLIGEGLIAVGI